MGVGFIIEMQNDGKVLDLLVRILLWVLMFFCISHINYLGDKITMAPHCSFCYCLLCCMESIIDYKAYKFKTWTLLCLPKILVMSEAG